MTGRTRGLAGSVAWLRAGKGNARTRSIRVDREVAHAGSGSGIASAEDRRYDPSREQERPHSVARLSRCPRWIRHGTAAPWRTLGLELLARAVRRIDGLPSPLASIRRHARDRRAVDRNRGRSTGDDVGTGSSSSTTSATSDDEADQAGPARARHAGAIVETLQIIEHDCAGCTTSTGSQRTSARCSRCSRRPTGGRVPGREPGTDKTCPRRGPKPRDLWWRSRSSARVRPGNAVHPTSAASGARAGRYLHPAWSRSSTTAWRDLYRAVDEGSRSTSRASRRQQRRVPPCDGDVAVDERDGEAPRAVRRGLHPRPGGATRRRRGAVPAVCRVRQLRLREEPRRGLCPDGLRVGVPQAVLPGPVRHGPRQRQPLGSIGRGAVYAPSGTVSPCCRWTSTGAHGARRPSGWGGRAGRWRGRPATMARMTATRANRSPTAAASTPGRHPCVRPRA